jgi:hypothetical protein
MTEYQGYRIEPFEPEPGQWRARISRLDGKNLKTAVPPSEQAYLDTMNTVSYGHRSNSLSRRSPAAEKTELRRGPGSRDRR